MKTKIKFREDEVDQTEATASITVHELMVHLENDFLVKFSMENGFVVAGERLYKGWGQRLVMDQRFRYRSILFSSQVTERKYKQLVIQEVQEAIDFIAQKTEDKKTDTGKDPNEVVVSSCRERGQEEL